VSKQNINIERLQIRLKGVSPQTARAAANELGSELLGRLSSPGVLGGNHAAKEIDAGTIRLSGPTGPAELRRTIAQSVVASINSRLKRRE
jgi:hypothetical protein